MRSLARTLCLFLWVCVAGTRGNLNFSIENTWNGESIEPGKSVSLNISSTKSGDLKLEFSAPYFGDPAPDSPSGSNFLGLWDYEVVEVYFLNDDKQYLQVEIGPLSSNSHGHYSVLLFNGMRNQIRHSLPLLPSTAINGDNWNGSVIIPRTYLPPNVTKFNGYTTHGTGKNREHWSLYPTDGSTTYPDFHNLNFFKPIDFNTTDPTLSKTTLSNIWRSAITKSKLKYTIEKTWNGESIAPSKPVTLNISSTKSGDLKLELSAPYFGDPAPDAPFGQHFLALWDYEVVEVYFLNDDEQYLLVQIGPHGHYTVLLFNGMRNQIRHSLPLLPSTTIKGDNWNGSVIIPRTYLPPNVTKFNAYAIHKTGKNREHWSLYPTDGSTTYPDFHNLNFFKPIDFNTTDPTLSTTTLSNIWRSAITKSLARTLCLFLWVCVAGTRGNLNFSIENTWNGESIEPGKSVSLNISSTKSGNLKLEISAPYFGDPVPDSPSGSNFLGLWDYEVVEVYFLNDDKQYLQVEIGPHGHYSVLLFNGMRNQIRHSLPLLPSTTIKGDNWNGSVIIPRTYLPPNVTKFNGYTTHGTGKNREHWSLYPTDGSTTYPDFHNLNFFKPIDFNTTEPTLSTTTLSNIWRSAITKSKLNYTIEKTWNGEGIAPSKPVTLNISSTKSGDLKLELSAPYFRDPAPDAPFGQHFLALWDYEVVEVYFLNDDEQYLLVQIGPHGHYTVLLFNGMRNQIRHSLPLLPSTTIKGDNWNGSVIIPRTYLPPNVTKFNAYAIHKTGKNREHWSLYPTDGSTTYPDFHNLNFFKPIDFNTTDPTLSTTTLSNIWRSAITKSKLNYTIEKIWNGESIATGKPVSLNISSSKSGDLKLEISAPYFADPAPNAPSGQHFLGLWNYEVVEVYFLNDDEQYLQVDIGPHGHYTVLLLNGVRNQIRRSLPLTPSTTINGDNWNGSVIIPRTYLPPNVTKFNAYAIHGTGENREYWSLYPTDGSTTDPDFHNLNFFKSIDFNSIDPSLSSTTLSNVWSSAINKTFISFGWNPNN